MTETYKEKPFICPQSDPVKAPSHYHVRCQVSSVLDDTAVVECRHVMLALGLADDFFTGAAFKYLWRCHFKENTIQDLEKAKQCLEYAIERLGEPR